MAEVPEARADLLSWPPQLRALQDQAPGVKHPQVLSTAHPSPRAAKQGHIQEGDEQGHGAKKPVGAVRQPARRRARPELCRPNGKSRALYGSLSMSVVAFGARPLILELASNFSSFFRCLRMVFCFSSTSSLIHLGSSWLETDTYVCTVLSSDFQPLQQACVARRGPSRSAS